MNTVDLSSPVTLFDSVAEARGWEDTIDVNSARAYAFAFTPSWEGFFSDVWRADDLRTLADKVSEIRQPGAGKLAYLYRQYADDMENDPDEFLDYVEDFSKGVVKTAGALPGRVTRAVTPWGPIVLGAAIVAALAMRR